MLWRLQNGELDNLSPKVIIFWDGEVNKLSPKVIVVSAGQSNQGDSPEEIAEGIKEICAVIRSKQPQAFLVLLVSSFLDLDDQILFQFSDGLTSFCLRRYFHEASFQIHFGSEMQRFVLSRQHFRLSICFDFY